MVHPRVRRQGLTKGGARPTRARGLHRPGQGARTPHRERATATGGMSAGGRAVALESPRRVDEGRLLLQSVVDELEERVSPWALARVVRSWALVNPSGHERFGITARQQQALVRWPVAMCGRGSLNTSDQRRASRERAAAVSARRSG
jgi:hypothetical protein